MIVIIAPKLREPPQRVHLLIPLPPEQRGFPIRNEFKVLMINPYDDKSSWNRGMYLFGGYAEIPCLCSSWAGWAGAAVVLRCGGRFVPLPALADVAGAPRGNPLTAPPGL